VPAETQPVAEIPIQQGELQLCSAEMPSGAVPWPVGSDCTVWHHGRMVTLGRIALQLLEDALQWLVLLLRSTEAVRAENLFLRRQLASPSQCIGSLRTGSSAASCTSPEV